MRRLATVILLAFILGLPMNASADGPQLVFETTSDFRLIWNDKGSGADRDGAFYRTQPPEGFFSIGDYGQNNYGTPRGRVVVVRAIDDDPNDPLLALPVDYVPIWKDTGSGADEDGSFWQPVPPDGYVCIGSVVQRGYSRPHVPDYRCLRRDQVERGEVAGLIWNDQGSGADSDVEIFALRGTDVIYAQGNYREPTQTLWRPRNAKERMRATGSFFLKTWKVTSTDDGTKVKDGQRFEIKKYSDGYGFVVLEPSHGGTRRLGDGNWTAVRLQLKEGKLTGIAPDTNNRVTISRTSDRSIHCEVKAQGRPLEQAGEWDAEDDGGSWDTEGRQSHRRPRRAALKGLNIQDIGETETHIVVEFESERGNPYVVGYPKKSGYRMETIESELARTRARSEASSDSDDFKEVRWVYDGESWTSRAAIEAGISGGFVSENPGAIYNYWFRFANYKGWYFHFRDGTGDVYSCSTPRDGNHFVKYNSNIPSIFGVR